MNRSGPDSQSNGTVTAVVLCYNHARFLPRCLESVLMQECDRLKQILFVDNCSSDESLSLAARILSGHPSAVVVSNSRTFAVCAAMNRALDRVSTEYFCGIAGDDFWEPHAVATLLAGIEGADPASAFAYGDANIVTEDGRLTGETMFGVKLREEIPPSGDQVFPRLVRGNWIPAMSTIVRRRAVLDVGSYDESLPYEDYDMWLRLSSRWPVASVPRVVSNYRQVPHSLGRQLAHIEVIRYRMLERHVHNGRWDDLVQRQLVREVARMAAYGQLSAAIPRATSVVRRRPMDGLILAARILIEAALRFARRLARLTRGRFQAAAVIRPL